MDGSEHIKCKHNKIAAAAAAVQTLILMYISAARFFFCSSFFPMPELSSFRLLLFSTRVHCWLNFMWMSRNVCGGWVDMCALPSVVVLCIFLGQICWSLCV